MARLAGGAEVISRLLAPFLPWIAGALAAAALAGAGVIWWQSGTIETLREDKASLERSVAALERARDNARLAAEVAEARAKGAQKIAAETEALQERIRNLELGECADVPLDPALTDLLRRGVRED